MTETTRRRVIGSLGLASAAPLAGASSRDKFAGVWKLVSAERRDKNGPVSHPFGDKPIGRISYDKAGRMAAQLMRRGRRAGSLATAQNSVDVMRNVSAEDLRDMASGFACYFGTYDVDEASQTVTHHVEGAFLPTWIGTDLKRKYKLSGNRLTLTAPGETSTTDLIWEREKD